MKKYNHLFSIRITLFILFSLGYFTSLYAQQDFSCEVFENPNQSRTRNFDECKYFIDLTKDQVLSMPLHEVSVVFHFKGNALGQNFTCNVNNPILVEHPLLFVPDFIFFIMDEINTRLSEGLEIGGERIDSRIRFKLANGDACNSSFFISNNESFNLIPNVLNIKIFDAPGSGSAGLGDFRVVNLHTGVNFFLNSNNTWEVARTCIHEFGHTADLDHTFFCNNDCALENNTSGDYFAIDGCFGECRSCQSAGCGTGCFGSSNSFFMGYGHGNHKFGICEYLKMMNFWVDNPPPSINNCNNLKVIDKLSIDDGLIHTWNGLKKINSDIEISNNSTLIITCANIEFGQDVKIVVKNGSKLIIDDSRISTGCGASKWAGIKVAGGNSDFDIEVKNGAVIENCSEAAITMFPTDIVNDPSNGIARIENSTFNNVRGAVGFFARTPNSINPSYVRNCTINNARWGVSNTNCQNIEVSDNTFNNIELECIFGSMGSYHIFNNTFNSGEQDILFMNTSPALSSRIEFNTFNGRNTGYHADGSVFAQNRIEWNQFYNGQIDILNDGHNSFRAWHNMSHAGLGGVSFSNGDRPGEYAFNTFSNNFIAQLPVGDNPGFNFFENCYTSSFTDVYIDGSVSPVIQQGFGDAANNCFTHQGNNSVISDLGGNPDPFTYVEPNDHDVDCRDAINAHNNVVIDKSGPIVSPPDCFDPFTTPPPIPPFTPCNPQEGQEEAARQWLVNKIKEIENNSNLTDDQKEKFLSIYRNCLKKVIGRLAEILIEVGDYNGARALYQPESSDDDKVMVYGLYIVEGDIVSASTYLNGLSSESGQMMDFKTVQLSNLQRIQSGYTYEPSTSELAAIRTIAEKDHPYAAYAKALFYAYTGEVIVSSMPQFVQQELANRSKKQLVKDKTVNISPNPFREQLNITLEGLDDPKIYVYDILGSTQSITFTKDYTTINTSNWSEGVYVVKVYDGSELIKTQKVVLVK